MKIIETNYDYTYGEIGDFQSRILDLDITWNELVSHFKEDEIEKALIGESIYNPYGFAGIRPRVSRISGLKFNNKSLSCFVVTPFRDDQVKLKLIERIVEKDEQSNYEHLEHVVTELCDSFRENKYTIDELEKLKEILIK